MKLSFIAFTDLAQHLPEKPKPIRQLIPKWFQKFPQLKNGNKKFELDLQGGSNQTVKACNPFLDALTTGYAIVLDADLVVNVENNIPKISWREGGKNFIETHDNFQVPKELFGEGYYSQALKFITSWIAKTPKGYSLVYTHPLNRTDLPFYTFAGVVESDSFERAVNLPFLLKKNFEGIIPAGTPIAQVIPIKRETWTHNFKEYNDSNFKKNQLALFTRAKNYYKKFHWVRKDYR